MSMKERYEAAMVLSGVGDAIGYRDGRWEFCMSGITMYEELKSIANSVDEPKSIANSVDQLRITKKDWPVSDDTLLQIATADALLEHGHDEKKDKLFVRLAERYVDCISSNDMMHRHPGNTCAMASEYMARALSSRKPLIGPFDKRGGGCGAAMRSMCIGLLYPTEELLGELVEVSIESGRLTHHHPTGYLGALAAALFTAYAIRDKPIIEWGKGLLDTMEVATNHIAKTEIEVPENLSHMEFFVKRWEAYLDERGIRDGQSEPRFPKSYGQYERDEFYRSISFDGTGGASGHDAPMIAYDAILGSGKDWNELCLRSMIHGGDSDSTGVIAAALYGAMYGFDGVSKVNYENVEFHKKLHKLGTGLFTLAEKIKKDRQAQRQGSHETPV